MNQYTIFPTGDSAVTMALGNRIDESLNQKVIAVKDWLYEHPFTGLTDVITAYSSVTILYDPAMIKAKAKPAHTVYQFISDMLETAYAGSVVTPAAEKLIHIPVCYEQSLGPDLELVAQEKQLSIEEVIQLHTGRAYRVYMIGFLPGFPYMASVDERITMGRKIKPRAVIAAGSVGLAGLQTGIYPLDSPGGWQIIGRTPVKLFDKTNTNFLRINAGDAVRFYAINRAEFDKLQNFKSAIAYY